MATQFEIDILAAVDDVITEAGITSTFRTMENNVNDPVDGTVQNLTPTTHDIVGSPIIEYEENLVDGSLIRKGDARIFTQGAITFDPEICIEVISGGVTWKVIAVHHHRSGESVAAYEFQLRK